MILLVATPTYRHEVMSQYVTSLVRDTLLATTGREGDIVFPPVFLNDTLVHYARNKIAKAFLEAKECTDLMFIDSDLGWDNNGLRKIMDTPGDIVGGVYRTKATEIFYPFVGENPRGLYSEVEGVPTGFMRITRAAMEAVVAAHQDPFEFEEHDGVKYGEDLTFCNRARRLGLSVVARYDIMFEHVGVHSWSGRAADDLDLSATLQGDE